MADIELSDDHIREVDSSFLSSTGIQGPFIAMNVSSNRVHLNKEDLQKLNELFGITNDAHRIDELEQELSGLLAQNRCDCKHPSCRRCADTRSAEAVLNR